MIRRIEALGYRSLRYVDQELAPFQILVGPNASGKSTFLDVVDILSDAMRLGVDEAVHNRSSDVTSLFWMRQGDRFELALEFEIPEGRRERLKGARYERARYEVALGLDGRAELAILGENLWLVGENGTAQPKCAQQELFPSPPTPPEHVVWSEGAKRGWRQVVTKTTSGNDYFRAETSGWRNPFRLGPKRLALVNLPEDEERFPVATWVKKTLLEGVQRVFLNSEAMRRPAKPGSPRNFLPDGSNLPWVIETLRQAPERYERWLAHVRTALPDVDTIDTVERPEDRHRYLRIRYRTGLDAPSWVVSDGTLRLLALTLIAYIDEPGRIYLIEEPENGIHPQAVETVFQSLSSTYDSQVLCASHSPVFLTLADPAQILCLARDKEGATDVVRGDRHPARDAPSGRLYEGGGMDFGALFAAGALG
ncbi:MAG: AAA family ATPase [Deltaproteobacteria bacterium]|nr:AAA family ATPase [Deltaproteobacteria bacterium]